MSAATRRSWLPFALVTERRLETPRGLGIITTLGAVAVALLISAVLIWVRGGDPIHAYVHIVRALAQKLKDPKVSALVEKWSERFDALDNE